MKKRNNSKNGQAMILTAIFFVVFTSIFIFGLITPIIKQTKITSDLWSTKNSFFMSESGMTDVIYRVKSGFSVNTGDTLPLFDAGVDDSVLTSIIDNLDGSKIITTTSDIDGYIRKTQTILSQNTGTSFNYGVQTGNGGLVITGSSQVQGNVYSNGDIIGGAGTQITGSAIAAGGESFIFKDETNEIPLPVSSSITFNGTGAVRDFAQSFQPSTTSVISKISIYIKKTNNPSSFDVKLKSDDNGVPGMELASAVLNSGDVTTDFEWVDLVFSSNPVLVKDTTYWLVIVGDTKKGKTSSDTYSIGANLSYVRGVSKLGSSDGVWSDATPSDLDGYFSLFLGSVQTQILGEEGDYMYIGSTPEDIVWASNIKHVSATGEIYCDTSSFNKEEKKCNTSRLNPETLPMPISQANISGWKNQALAGGVIVGDLNVGSSGKVVGYKKITGDLLVNGEGTLMVTGTIWVQGTIKVTGGGKISLAPSLGPDSEIIISDKYVKIDGGSEFFGSGTTGSYPVVISTSICPNTYPCSTNDSAISLSGGAGAVVLVAPFGRINIIGGSDTRSVTGDSIYISGGGKIIYESGLASLSFSSGPSGSFSITSWKELEN
jgi:hypothetical protein